MAKSNAARKQDAASSNDAVDAKPAPMAAAEADKLIHERKRLAIISALAVNPKLTFTELKSLLDMSDGNLSIHTQKLEAAGFLKVTKTFEGRMPKTTYTITAKGKTALERYLGHMEELIARVRAGQK